MKMVPEKINMKKLEEPEYATKYSEMTQEVENSVTIMIYESDEVDAGW